MAHDIYEERVNIPNFSLCYMQTLNIFGTEHKNIEIYTKNERVLLFLHIKTMNLSNMMFPHIISSADLYPRFAFSISEQGKENNTIKHVYQSDTPLLKGGSFTYSIDNLIVNINYRIEDCIRQQDTALQDCAIVAYPYFRFNEGKLYCRYYYLRRNGSSSKKMATLMFDKVIWEIIGKYFDLECASNANRAYYKILPVYTLDVLLADKTIDTSYAYTVKDITEFIHPRWKINLVISNESDPKFNVGDNGYVSNSFIIDTSKSHIALDKYILLSDLITSDKPVSYRITVPISMNCSFLNDVSIELDGEYIILKDTFEQFNCFSLNVGYIYTCDEYRELSYRKLMGITAQTVYLQNATSTDKLTEIVSRLRDHFPNMGDPRNASTWQTLRDLLDKKDYMEEIYYLLYQIHPVQSIGPPESKKGKIDF